MSREALTSIPFNNIAMNTIEKFPPLGRTFTPEQRARLEAVVRRAMSGKRDPELMRKARERIDRRREENLKRFGVQEIAVSLIREGRE